jgi:hypothetical protein
MGNILDNPDAFMFRLEKVYIFYPEDGSSNFFRNVGTHIQYDAIFQKNAI